MRLLLLTLTYPPEPAEHIEDIAKYLAQKGISVTVVTCIPSYPLGKVYQDYKRKYFVKEQLDNLTIFRLPVIPSQSPKMTHRSMYYLMHGFWCLLYGIFIRSDIIIAYHPPMTTGMVAYLLSYLKRTKFLYWVHDMWPEIIESALGETRLTRAIGKIAIRIYHRSNKVLVLSSGFKQNLINKGLNPEKIDVIYNWVRLSQFKTVTVNSDLYEKYSIDRNDFVLMYAGSQGKMQALEYIIQAMELVNGHRKIVLMMLGIGTEHEKLKELTANLNLNDKVKFAGRVPEHELAEYYSLADAFIVHLKDVPINRCTIPHKIYGYMACNKPTIAAAYGDARNEIVNASAGKGCNPEDKQDIANAINHMEGLSRDEFLTLGRNGRLYIEKNRTLVSEGKKMHKILEEIYKA